MITVFDLSKSADWNKTVQSFADHDVYYLSNYVRPFALHGDGEPLLIYYEDVNCRGINVVMKRDIADDKHFNGLIERGKWFDFATPYGYGGWLIEGTDTDGLFSAYENWCKEHHIVCEFVRFHPIIKNHIAVRGYKVIPMGETVAMDLSSKDTIWNNLTGQNRNKFRKALKNGVEIRMGYSKELFKVFKTIYDMTMDKDHADAYYYFNDEFYDCIYEQLKNNATLFYAVVHEEIAAIALMIYANGKMHYHLSGSKREFLNVAPTNPLLVNAAQWGCEHGMKTLHLGGGFASQNDNLLEFKKSFYRGELCRYHIGKKIFDTEIYDRLIELRGGGIQKPNFFPIYRG